MRRCLKMEELAVPSFGKEIRDTWLFLDKEVAFTNHGSYGTLPRPVREAHAAMLDEVESNPDSWFRWKLTPLYLQACRAVANFVGTPSGEVVLVDNATTAVNTVMRSLKLGPGDGVMITSLTYGACKNTALAVCEQTGAELHVMEIKLPVASRESIANMYQRYLEDHPGVRLALVDHITSPSAILLPVKEITAVCHSKGIRVMIDGAHSPGQVELRLRDIGADYFTGNFHKWMFCSRGCALLHVREELHNEVYPLVVSHTHLKGFQERFAYTGTRDCTPHCMALAAIQFFNKIGGLPAVSSHNCSLLSWATDLLCQRWGVEPLPIPPDMKSPFLSVVGTPDCLGPPTVDRKEELQLLLFQKYKVQSVFDIVDGKLWCRICAQVYNTKEDYTRLADAVADLVQSI